MRVHRSALRYRRPVHEYLRYRSAIFTPLNGPFIQHHKTPIRFARGAIRYSEIDPTLAKPEDVAQWRAWVQELEEEQREG